jgi:hypothetical protein
VVVDSKRRAAMRRPIERPDRLMTRANDILAGGEDWTRERAGWMSAGLELFFAVKGAKIRRSGGRRRSVAGESIAVVGGGRMGSGKGTISRNLDRLRPEIEEKLESSEDFERRWLLPGSRQEDDQSER